MQLNIFILFGFFILLLSLIIAVLRLWNVSKKAIGNIKNENEFDLIIVGAGLSGLTAAYEANKLTNSSLKILLLEASPYFGGNSINEIDGINILISDKKRYKKGKKDNFSLFYNDSLEFGQFAGDPDLLTVLVDKSQELLDFFINDLNCNNLSKIKSEGSRFPRTFISNIIQEHLYLILVI